MNKIDAPEPPREDEDQMDAGVPCAAQGATRAAGPVAAAAPGEPRAMTVAWRTERTPRIEAAALPDPSWAEEAGWCLESPPAKALQARPVAPRAPGQGGTPPLVAVALFGLDAAGLCAALKQIDRMQRGAKPILPLFLTDDADQMARLDPEGIVEFFPRSVYFEAPSGDRLTARFRTIWAKWAPPYMLDFSKPGLLRSRLTDYDLFRGANLDPGTRFNPRRPTEVIAEPAVADIAALKAEYLDTGLDQEADTFVLYRILGNDLPPRHEAGQTLANLEFILEHEPRLTRCEKRWVVNRIAAPEQEAAILALLEKHKQPYLHIPFDLENYAQVDWDLDSFPQLTFFLNGSYDDMQKADQMRAEAHARRHKNRYLMNNNGARNAALRDGRTRAKWVLPWDGNCYLSRAAWSQILRDVGQAPYMKYHVVPMARTLDNADLLKRGHRPETGEEPQILFRRDASEEFEESYHYGRRPKVELLWRLGVRGAWDSWQDDVWDLPRPARAREAGDFGQAGWVARLSSGSAHLDEQSTEALVGRGAARAEAIVTILDELDRKALARGFDPARLTAYDEDTLLALRAAPQDSSKGLIRDRLLQEAELALQRGPYSVTDKTLTPPSGDKHDYYHPAPYWWPDPNAPDGRSGTYRDGLRAPGTVLYEPLSDQYDRTRLQRLFDDTTVLALAGTVSGKTAYLDHAARLLRCWFIDPETRMAPHLEFAQVNPAAQREAHSASGLIEMKDLYFLLDAVRLLERAGAWPEADKAALTLWLEEYLTWLLESPQGLQEARARNNHGTCYDLQVGAIAAYLGDIPRLCETFRRSRERIAGQFDGNGVQKHELQRTQTRHYCYFNLQCWTHLATLAKQCGDRLWEFTSRDGRGLAHAFGWLLAEHLKPKWGHKQLSAFDKDRILPLIYAAQARFTPEAWSERALGFARKPIFHPHDGIMPFWMLSASLHARGAQEAPSALTKVIAEAERAARNALVEGPLAKPAPAVLERRLWRGYSGPARDALELALRAPKAPASQRALAAWGLGRWTSYLGDYKTSLEFIREARALGKMGSRGLVLAEANCLIQLGQPEAARELALQMLARNPDDPNLLFQIANTYGGPGPDAPAEGEAERLAWINRVFLTKGAVGIEKRDAEQPLSLSNIRGAILDGPPESQLQQAKVSVVMPMFNGAATIGNAIRSMREQTWSNLEIIVVDDCSSDESCEIVTRIAAEDPRVSLIQMPANGGAYLARNAGMAQASGDYVTVHDADDWSHPQKIEWQLKRLREAEGAVGVISRWLRVYDDLFAVGYWRPEEMLISLNQSSFLIPKAVLSEIGPWDNVRAGGDNEFIWRFKTRYGARAVAETDRDLPLALSMVRPDSLTQQSVTHVKTVFHGLRKDYFRTYRRWQTALPSEELTLPWQAEDSRAYPAPRPILPRDNRPARLRCLFIADFSNKAVGVDWIAAHVEAESRRAGRIGIFHWPDYENDTDLTFRPQISELLDAGRIEQISAFQEARAKTVVLCDPYLARIPIEGIPEITAQGLEVLCPAAGRSDAMFDPRRRRMPTEGELEALFKLPCRWVSVDSTVPAAPAG
ncbi:alginate lyase family protein [Roseivivax sp. GX 12232]|uniref:alginate lyase family protein n=1 Tax=Roseivivax sp. GX 12232 TaxID=2900547 RepID=UPI001E33134D|nr:alginate lyase family protein [Roseivivax sp. GX 12232]MCE0505454.1 alginate lyase family protein [Roseivivax sp. GX 12232]